MILPISPAGTDSFQNASRMSQHIFDLEVFPRVGLAILFIIQLAHLSRAQGLQDADLDRIPDSWESQYGLNVSGENFRVGSGVDGNLAVNTGQTTYLNDTAILISSAQNVGSTELAGVIPVSTRMGDVFLLHATQDGNPAAGAPAGTFELVQIVSIQDGKVGLRAPLKHTYNPTTGGKIQCIYVPQYDTLQVNGTIAARPWNGNSGGIIAVIANDVVISAGGKIDSSGAGFRSGSGFSMYGSFNGMIGSPGEGNVATAWPLPNSTTANSSGGAGGDVGGVGGGGTGASVSYFGFGRGGGSGGVGPTRIASIYGPRFDSLFTSTSGSGGKGGGFLIVICRYIHNGGVITTAGEGGQGGAASGGGGAGGSILLISRVNGTGLVSSLGGAGGALPSTTGAGSIGKIRLERGSYTCTPNAATTGDGYFDSQTYFFLTTYADVDQDGLNDYAEYLAGTSPLAPDTDLDGVPDDWEVRFGTSPTVADANADPDGDGRTNMQEFLARSNPRSGDGDQDGLSDAQELQFYGTDPLSSDTDKDGMTDDWEFLNGLNPLVANAEADRDLDGLTNKEEFDLRTQGYKANALNSKSGLPGDDGMSDYRRLKGEGWVRRSYDKNDRLISTERDTGVVQIYDYDGNSQKMRDVLRSSLDSDGDGLPDSWEFDQGLTFDGVAAGTGNNGASGDPDQDGFSNFLEWKARTDPRDANSHLGTGAVPVSTRLVSAPGFVPTNWVMAVGQLDGFGADEVVVGADGMVGTSINQFSVYQNTGLGWVVASTSVGNLGINSLAIGEVASGRGASIFLGSRPPSGVSSIQDFRRSGTSWLKWPGSVAEFLGTGIAQVIEVNSAGVLGLLSPTSQAADGIFRMPLVSDTWSAPTVVSSSSGKRSWPTPVPRGMARWLDAGGIEINTGAPPLSLGAIKNPTTGSWYFLSPSAVTWPNADLYATQNGGHLVTVNDAAEQTWIQTNFPSQNMWIGLLRGSTGDGWQWVSGEPSNYRNWYLGEPNNAGGNEPYGNITSSWTWNDSNGTSPLKGLVEIPASSVALQTLPEPAATSKLIWRGRSLASGQLRTGTNSGTSLVYAFVNDRDTSGTVNSGDAFVVGEYELASQTSVQRTTVTLPISSSIPSSALGLTVVQRNSSPRSGVLAIGEPDGTVSLWTAPDAGSPLIRKIFTTEFKGKSWQQLDVFHESSGSEGLVGLLIDPSTPSQCQLIYWSPETIESALNGTSLVLNTPPKARVLATPASGGTSSTVAVRIWDAEAHSSSLLVQYQRSGETVWNTATILTANGGPAASPLSSQPGGSNHSLLWDAGANLGTTFNGTVLLRTQATDAAAGEWSEPMPYIVRTDLDLDTDGDGFSNVAEAAFGTDPSIANSRPSVNVSIAADGSTLLTWPHIPGRAYRVEFSSDLKAWTTIQSLNGGELLIPKTDVRLPSSKFYRVRTDL